MIQTKLGFHWSSTFRVEDFWKSLRRTTDIDDGRQVMAIANMTLWVRWAKNQIERDQQDEMLGKYIIEAFISRCESFSFEYEFLYQYKKGTILSYSFGSLFPSILMSMKMLGYKKH